MDPVTEAVLDSIARVVAQKLDEGLETWDNPIVQIDDLSITLCTRSFEGPLALPYLTARDSRGHTDTYGVELGNLAPAIGVLLRRLMAAAMLVLLFVGTAPKHHEGDCHSEDWTPCPIDTDQR